MKKLNYLGCRLLFKVVYYTIVLAYSPYQLEILLQFWNLYDFFSLVIPQFLDFVTPLLCSYTP